MTTTQNSKWQWTIIFMLSFLSLSFITSCNNEENEDVMVMEDPMLTGESIQFNLEMASNPMISGTVTLLEMDDSTTKVILQLDGTSGSTQHPAHLHVGNAVDGGGIAVDLSPVNPSTGRSETIIAALNDGSPITFNELRNFNGYVAVHLSPTELSTIIALGDIGPNAITGESRAYILESVDFPRISGMVMLEKRQNGTTRASLMLNNTQEGMMYPAHIHFNSAAEGGGIAIDLGAVNGETGMNRINITQLSDGNPISYEELKDFDGYVNVHLSMDQLDKLVAQTDIGQNALTGAHKIYPLQTKDVNGISGIVRVDQRKNGTSKVRIKLAGTPNGGMHPAHIHFNTAAEGGDIAVMLNDVIGTTGISTTTVMAQTDGTPISYEQLLDFNGYINVHLSIDELGTVVAQGDIGQNELVGESKTYSLNTLDIPGINGQAVFEKRKNGFSRVSLMLEGTSKGGNHPAHIHFNSAIEGGGIAVMLNNVNGSTGMSVTSVSALTDGSSITFDELLDFDGYINVHLSSDELSTIFAQGDIGQNELTGNTRTYQLMAVDGFMGNGSLMIAERRNGSALATLQVNGTMPGDMHPAHIHNGSLASQPGTIAVNLGMINGSTGKVSTNITEANGEPITYAQLLALNGYVNVHKSMDELNVLLVQGNVGSNAN